LVHYDREATSIKVHDWKVHDVVFNFVFYFIINNLHFGCMT